MWTIRYFPRIDMRLVGIVLVLQLCGLLTVAAYSQDFLVESEEAFFSLPAVKSQLQWLALGWGCFFFVTGLNYSLLREWTWLLYGLSILALVGLFFTDPIARVQRWYRVPVFGFSLQPSECAKLAVVITLSWFLERRAVVAESFTTLLGAGAIVLLPFFLILKQPDLGTATVLYPTTLVILYVGGISKNVVRILSVPGIIVMALVFLTFSGLVSHDALRPSLNGIFKEYQIERLNPNTHHQKAAQTAIAIGGALGTGWRQGEFWRGGSLPAPYTDSIFAAFGEEFGLVGLSIVLVLYYALIACTFQAAASAKDPFGRLMSVGIAIYVAVHVLVNIGMMSGCFPITGVPLVLMSYGGSSMAATMTALGLSQSVYSRRFMF
jgi:rod shape determining protein RodA